MAEEAGHPEQRWQRLWDLFDAALEKDPSERSAFLQDSRGSDPELCREVERLLAAHSEGSSLLDQPPVLGPDLAQEAALENASVEPPGEFDLPEGPQETSQRTLNQVETLAGRFEIIRLLGKGGGGAVHEAFDRELGSSVALKRLRPEIALDPQARERFRREINLARRVTHPNACRIFDLFHHGEEVVFLTMELLRGETLAERLQRGGPMSPSEVLPIVEQVAAALTAAHQVGVVHRDLKSSNVMLVPSEQGARAVVTDFGIAITTLPGDRSALDLTRTGQLLGTPAYMAPEQLQGGKITTATDVYALGLVIYEMLTAKLPFAGDTPFSVAAQRLHKTAPSPRQHLPDLDRNWERTILRCLQRDPRDRFQTPAQVVAALKGEIAPGRLFPRRRLRLGIGLGVTAAALLVVATLLLWPRTPVQGPESMGRDSAPGSEATPLAFEERDWVLIAAFENRTGETLFDDTLEHALGRELSNSRFVNVVPRERIGDTLRLMRKPPDTTVDAALGRAICLRDGGIRALLTGRVEKLGSTYLLSTELVDPTGGVTVASLSEEAQNQEQVLPAVRRLSNRLRETLGEELSLIRESEQKLAKVTTPSLRALQLFTQADTLIPSGDFEAAEELLRQAISEDPEFASAFNHLAWAIQNQRRPKEDFLPYAQRAFELSDQTTEPERYFIRASYFNWMEQPEKMVANYQALLRLDPDHPWASNNLAGYYHDQGSIEEAITHISRAVELRSNDFYRNYLAGAWLAIEANRPTEAELYIQRTAEAAETNPSPFYGSSWVWLYPAHRRWLEGDLEGVLKELDRWRETVRSSRGRKRRSLAWRMGQFYLALGRLEAAEEIFQLMEDTERRDNMLREVDYLRMDEDEGAAYLKRHGLLREGLGTRRAARGGLLSEARDELSSWQDRARQETDPAGVAPTIPQKRILEISIKLSRGEIALAEGNTAEAISLLQEGVALLRHTGVHAYFRCSESLASAWERQGNLSMALQTLEDASQQKNRTLPLVGPGLFGSSSSAKLYWMRVQLRLAELYRKLGREAEAQLIEAELRELLAYADPDLWLLRQLPGLEESAAVPSPR